MTFVYPHMKLSYKIRKKCIKVVGRIHNFFQEKGKYDTYCFQFPLVKKTQNQQTTQTLKWTDNFACIAAFYHFYLYYFQSPNLDKGRNWSCYFWL